MINEDKQDAYSFADETADAVYEPSKGSWKILIVDDDRSIHNVSLMVLSDLRFEGKELIFLHAYSSKEAKTVLQENSDIAVILLDVVMEEENAGLKLVKYLREDLKNTMTRIILRTGQPGYAPEKSVIIDYEINDYKEKTELTSTKFITAVIAALRSYRDITIIDESKKMLALEAKQAIKEVNYNLKVITDALPVLIGYIDENKILQFNNQAYQEWLSKDNENICGIDIKSIFDEDGYNIFEPNCNQALQGKSTNFDMPLLHKSHGKRNMNVILIPHTVNNKIKGCFSLITDITERKKTEDHLNYLANHDVLTNIYNRTFFDVYLTHAINKAERDNKKLAILFIDLDKFKTVNDVLGHEVGDLLLIRAAESLKDSLRKSDILARFGGDEFIILLEDIQDNDEIINVAQKICQSLIIPFAIKANTINISASIGISIFPDNAQNNQILIRNADLAMYVSKQKGGNAYHFYTEKTATNVNEKLSLEDDLQAALDKNEFELCYQTIVDVKTKIIQGIEASLQWHSPKKGLIHSDKFLRLDESTSLNIAIERWVLRKACEDLKKFHLEGNKKLIVSVNLSARQFLHEDLEAYVSQILEETQLEAKFLELELAESLLMSNIEKGIAMMNNLKCLGIKLAIDDFGTGYSSLNYLSKLPADTIKIDKSFIKDSNENTKNLIIVSALGKMLHDLGFNITAEGIETNEQLIIVHEKGCDKIQGFLVCAPQNFDSIRSLLQEQQKKLF